MGIGCCRILLLGGLLTLTLTRPALPQSRGGEDEISCPAVCGCGNVLNGRAIELPTPAYPKRIKGRGVSGTVTVFVIADEGGRISDARACFGPQELRQLAEEAARKARINPTLLSGVAVKTRGVLIYTFPRKEHGRGRGGRT